MVTSSTFAARTPSHHRQRAISKALLYVILIGGAFVALLPFLYMIANSLKTYGETITRVSALPFDPKFWPKVPQWTNYVEAWQDADFSRYFFNSLIIATVTVSGIYVTSILAAYAFAKLNFAGKNVIFTILLATLMIPEMVLLIPNYLTVARFGWIDRLPALTVPFMGSAFFIFLLRQFFNQIPTQLLESGRIDGATNIGMLFRIVVPLSRAPLFTVGFLAFTGSWNALSWPLVVTQTPKWRPITVGLTSFINEAAALIHLRLAGSMIALLPVIVIYMIAQRQITEAIARTGLKG
ncbi:MAG: carbohydrate ABC transporter permease [Spirochaetales bacterium]|nr:carbohydrate ABC transporter permease [Spirochaetales bacterium]